MTTEKRKLFMRWLFGFVKWVVVPFLALEAVMDLVWRSRYQPLIDGLRALNKRIMNPATMTMMKFAGRWPWSPAVVRHRGRSSGKAYATPVMAEPTPDGYIIPPFSGEHVDWLKNELAAGGCEIEDKGVSYPVGRPEVVDREAVAPFLPSVQRRLFDLQGVEKYLRVKRGSVAPETEIA